jgi:hypothetical protein
MIGEFGPVEVRGSLNFRIADYPGMIAKGNADLCDLPLGGT